jgi:serine/threonine protein kinase
MTSPHHADPRPQTPAPEGTVALPGASGAAVPDAGPATDRDLPPAETVPADLANHPRYRITRLLGQGGMGAVYEAEHRLMERTVALKVIHHQFTADAGAVERFRREVKAAARLHHPNIVTAYDADQAGDTHFLVMEFVPGQSLAARLRDGGPLPIREACDYARQAALGLQYAHEKGMVHRDVKPDNLMLSDGRVKILDFGLARFAQERAADAAAQAPTVAGEAPPGQLTAVGAVMGTPDYIAPEQAGNAHAADGRADIYSLGCTLYQMLTGRVPYPDGTALDKIVKHTTDEPAPLAALRPDVPAALAAVVRRMMARAPADRYPTPADAAAALEPFARPQEVRPRRRRRLVLLLAALVVGSATGAAVWFLANVQGLLPGGTTVVNDGGPNDPATNPDPGEKPAEGARRSPTQTSWPAAKALPTP